jgi:hypothetical protein
MRGQSRRFTFLQSRTGMGDDMGDVAIGVQVGVLTFICGFAGMWLQKWLPEAHMSSGARDMIGAVMGLIALLLALVLGTLVGSAYGFFATQKSNVEVLSARSIQLDMALKQFGPETGRMRAGLQGGLNQAYKAIWVDHLDPLSYDITDLVENFQQLNMGAAQLQAKTPDQIAAAPTINVSIAIIEQTRLLMSLQLASPISWPLLGVVVSWAMLLFAGYGVMARLNGTAVMAAFIGAFAIGSAVFLILELNQPFSGLFRIPGVSMETALRVVNK